jgi:LPXTG-site transpeptidase (sortase) family protein
LFYAFLSFSLFAPLLLELTVSHSVPRINDACESCALRASRAKRRVERSAKVGLFFSVVALSSVGFMQLGSTANAGRADLEGPAVAASPATADRQVVSAAAVPALATEPAGPEVPVVEEPGTPARIAVPSLDVDALVLPAGIEEDGSMEIPDSVAAGWFRLGPKPGSTKGSAVIVGHVDHKGAQGVFYSLRRLELGQELFVTDDVGKRYRYRVTERYQVNKSDLPTQTLFQRDGEPNLTLITCGGYFDRKARKYDDNIVIRAVPVSDSDGSPSLAREANLL